jgi:hypothetical protein
MSFKVKDLSVSLSSDDASTCTTLTKPTGCVVASIYGLDARQQDLAVLKSQLRKAMTRS